MDAHALLLREWTPCLARRAPQRGHRPLPTESARRLINILDGTEPLEACTDDLRRYVAHLLQHRSPATSAVRYRLTAAVLRLGTAVARAPSRPAQLLKASEGPASGGYPLTRRVPEPAARTAARSSA